MLTILRGSINLLLILFLSSQIVYSQNNQNEESGGCKNNLPEIKRLADETAVLFKQNKFDDAYSKAQKVEKLAETYCRSEKETLLAAKTNLAEIQIKRKKIDDAKEILERNLSLAETVYGEKNVRLNTYLNYLLKLSLGNSEDDKFEQLLLKSIAVKKGIFGISSYDTMLELVRLGDFYERKKNFEKAEVVYLEAVQTEDAIPLNAKRGKISALTQYRLFLTNNFGEDGRKKIDEFIAKRSPKKDEADDTRRHDENDSPQILNGRAIRLVRPAYPAIASNTGARGEVRVEITIDERGDVAKAKAVSGNPLLRDASEKAAKASKFLTTYADGKPIKVEGIIVYNFAY